MKRNSLLFAAVVALALPAAAQSQQGSPPSPSRPDLDQPSQATPPSDQKSRDIQMDRGLKDVNKAPAAKTGTGTSSDVEAGGMSDVEVLSRLHKINRTEIDLANVAKSKGQMAQVKSYADMMARDHQQADQDLDQFAKEHKMTLREPQATSPTEKQMMTDDDKAAANLRNLSGAAFDKQYADAMLQGHSDAIALVEAAKAKTTTAAVRAYYDKLLPVLRKHRDQAADIVATIQTQGETGTGTSEDQGVKIEKKNDY